MNAQFWFTLAVAALVVYLIYYHIRHRIMLGGEPVPKDEAEAHYQRFGNLWILIFVVLFLYCFLYGLWNLYWDGEFRFGLPEY